MFHLYNLIELIGIPHDSVGKIVTMITFQKAELIDKDLMTVLHLQYQSIKLLSGILYYYVM